MAGVSLVGLVATLTMPPEPKGASLKEFSESRSPTSAVTLSLAESRGPDLRPPGLSRAMLRLTYPGLA